MLPEDVPPASRDAAIGLADILVAGGQHKRARSLLATIIGRWLHEVGVLKRPELWFLGDHPIALALYGDRKAALAMLERALQRVLKRDGDGLRIRSATPVGGRRPAV